MNLETVILLWGIAGWSLLIFKRCTCNPGHKSVQSETPDADPRKPWECPECGKEYSPEPMGSAIFCPPPCGTMFDPTEVGP